MALPVEPRRMKILFLSHSADWFGAEHCLFRLLKGINPRKYEAVVVLPGHGRLEERIHELGVRSRLLEVGWWVKMAGSSERGEFHDGSDGPTWSLPTRPLSSRGRSQRGSVVFLTSGICTN